MRTIPVYQALAEDIRRMGVDTVFGLIADDICQLIATLDGIGVHFFNARHETSAIMAAEGYASATGRLGIAAVGRGPATANGIHGAVGANRTGSPVLIITGEPPLAHGEVNGLGPDLKAFKAQAVLTASGVRVFAATSAQGARAAFADAVACAMLGQTVTLHLPMDIVTVQIEVEEDEAPSLRDTPQPQRRVAPRAPAIETAAALLRKSRKPLIVAGIGAHRSGARGALERLAEKSGALLATSLKGKDLFRGHPLDLGIMGSSSHTMARRHFDEADCVIVFGAGLNTLTLAGGTSVPEVPLIHVDTVRTHIGRWGPSDVAVVGDARLVAEQLAEAIEERAAQDKPFHSQEVRERIAAFGHTQDFKEAHTQHTVDPRAFALELDKLLPAQRSVVYDGGNFMFVWAYLAVPDPSFFKSTLDFASVGLGIGTAMGMARARPESTTVLFIGDGGLLMTLGELETVIREDLPMIIVVMNDAAYGAEVHLMRSRGLPVSTAQFADVDFAAVAAPLGYDVATVRSMDDLRRLAPALAKPAGPMLIDCKINGAVVSPFIAEFVE